MRVVVTGGTGFLGPAVVEELHKAGHELVLIEHNKHGVIPQRERIRRVQADITDAATLRGVFDGADAVVHLVAIIREQPDKGVTFEHVHVEGTRNVVQAAQAAGVKRFLLMSANGVEARTTPYFRTKWQMEQLVKTGGFDWTIFRPSYISGSSQGGFDAQFADVVDKFPVLPSFAGGHFEMQPVSRKNVAEAFARALEKRETFNETYVLVGPERFTWNEYLRRLTKVRGKHRMLAPVPGNLVAKAADSAPFLFPVPVSGDQIRMLTAGNIGDPTHAVEDLGLHLETWDSAVAGLRTGGNL